MQFHSRGGAEVVVRENSSFAQMASASSASGSSKAVTLPDFTLYHYFRPNRAPEEMTRPFEKYYRYPVETSTAPTVAAATESRLNGLYTKVNLSVFGAADGKGSWTPVFDTAVERSKKIPNSAAATLTPPAPFRPPTSYLPPLFDRLAIAPGGCFGRRDHQWGTYF